jgi:signal peptidase II
MKLNKINKNLYLNIFIVIFIFFLDRVTKNYVMYISNNSFGSEIFSSKYLNILPIWNKGISFGLLSFDEIKLYNLLSLFISIIILLLVIIAFKNQGLRRFLFLIIIGGALGNLYDRVKFNGVLDFIDFHVGNFHWFIFNVSDIFITIGVIGMIFIEMTNKSKN